MDGKLDLPQTRCAEVDNIWLEIRAIDLLPCVIEDRARGISISYLLGTFPGINLGSKSMLISCGMQKTYRDMVCRRGWHCSMLF